MCCAFGAHGQDAAVDSRVQRLDASVEHLGEAGVVRHRRHGDAVLRPSSRAVPPLERISMSSALKSPAEVDHAVLVEDADQGASDAVLHHGSPCSRLTRLRFEIGSAPHVAAGAAPDGEPDAHDVGDAAGVGQRTDGEGDGPVVEGLGAGRVARRRRRPGPDRASSTRPAVHHPSCERREVAFGQRFVLVPVEDQGELARARVRRSGEVGVARPLRRHRHPGGKPASIT